MPKNVEIQNFGGKRVLGSPQEGGIQGTLRAPPASPGGRAIEFPSSFSSALMLLTMLQPSEPVKAAGYKKYDRTWSQLSPTPKTWVVRGAH